MLKGIIAIRQMHTRAVEETGFTCADEMLYPENHRYLSDLLSYVAIGARSVEDQQHRLTASGTGIPVGMKLSLIHILSSDNYTRVKKALKSSAGFKKPMKLKEV